MIEDNVDEILLIAKERAIPVIDEIIDMINFVETIGLLYDPSPFADHLKGTRSILEILYYLMENVIDRETLLSWFFDVQQTGKWYFPSFSSGVSSYSRLLLNPYDILGISEWAGEDLNFSDAKYNLIKGTDKLPGICSILYEEMSAYSPEGGWALLKLYDDAKGNPQKEKILADGYGTTWYKLEKIVDYYRDYYILEVVPQNLNNSLIDLFFPVSGMNKTEMANYFFQMQWANCLIIPGGIDLSKYEILPGAPSGVLGLEAGYPEKLDMNISKIYELWDVLNPHSIVNNNGNRMWGSAVTNFEIKSSLRAELNLTSHDMDSIIRWRVRLINEIIPVLGGVYFGLGVDLTTFKAGLQIVLIIIGISLDILGFRGIYKNIKHKRRISKNLKGKLVNKTIKKMANSYH